VKQFLAWVHIFEFFPRASVFFRASQPWSFRVVITKRSFFFGRKSGAGIGEDICHKPIFSNVKIIQLFSMMLL
jgi:hypothetical protein